MNEEEKSKVVEVNSHQGSNSAPGNPKDIEKYFIKSQVNKERKDVNDG